MKVKNKVVYVPPVYEEIQHEVTSVDENNVPLRSSFHTDVPLLQRIESLRYDAQTLESLKASLQPMIDNSNFRSQFEETLGSYRDWETDRKSTRLNSSHITRSRMPSSA